MSASPTAHRDTRSLLTSLARAGWGELAGYDMQATRSTLSALVNLLPFKSGQGQVTVPQVADVAGLSVRWVGRCMHLLEDLGLLKWTRGGVVDGRPLPSTIRIVKTALVDLIKLARPALNALQTARRIATLNRIRGIKRAYSKRGQRRSPKSDHQELSAYPSTPKGGSPQRGDSPPLSTTPERNKAMRVACAHHPDVRQCHRCTRTDTPPHGYHFDWSVCTTCYQPKEVHDRWARRLTPETGGHPQTPELVKGELHPTLPDKHRLSVVRSDD